MQVQVLPDALTGLVAQPAEYLALNQGVVGSTPTEVTGLMLKEMGVSSNGKTAGLHPANEGSTPSTVHCERWCLWCNRRACDPVKVEAAGSTPPL